MTCVRSDILTSISTSYRYHGVISEDGKWRMARFAGGFFTPDPAIAKPANPGSVKAATRPGMLPDTLSTTIMAPRGGAHYYITDYQGNNVAVADSTGHVEQRTDYYPYGTPWANTASHPFLYSGKEWLPAHGLNEYDFNARRYTPLLPRFTTPDPLCEKRPWESPFLYCGANPVNAIDPTGKDYFGLHPSGRIILLEETNEDYDIITAYQQNSTVEKEAAKLKIGKEVMQSKRQPDVQYQAGDDSKNADVDLYRGGESMEDFYDFVISNSKVEWSKVILRTASGEFQTAVGTTHEYSSDLTQDVVRSEALKEGSYIIDASHFHTSLSQTVSFADVEVAKKIRKDFPDATFHILFPKKYHMNAVEYDDNTTPGILPDVDVIYKK